MGDNDARWPPAREQPLPYDENRAEVDPGGNGGLQWHEETVPDLLSGFGLSHDPQGPPTDATRLDDHPNPIPSSTQDVASASAAAAHRPLPGEPPASSGATSSAIDPKMALKRAARSVTPLVAANFAARALNLASDGSNEALQELSALLQCKVFEGKELPCKTQPSGFDLFNLGECCMIAPFGLSGAEAVDNTGARRKVTFGGPAGAKKLKAQIADGGKQVDVPMSYLWGSIEPRYLLAFPYPASAHC